MPFVNPARELHLDLKDLSGEYLPSPMLTRAPGPAPAPPNYADTSPRPYPLGHRPEDLYMLVEESTRLYAMTRLQARMAVGLGWNFIPASKALEGQRDTDAEIEDMTERFANIDAEPPGPRQPYGSSARNEPGEILMAGETDRYVVGNGFFEGVPTRDGKRLASLHYQPALHIRWRRDGQGYMRTWSCDGKPLFYKRPGDIRDMDAETGEIRDAGEVPWERRASILFHRKLPYPGCDWYGLPSFVSSAASAATKRDVAEINHILLSKDVYFPLTTIVDGGRLDPKSHDGMMKLLSKKGNDQDGEDGAPGLIAKMTRGTLLQPDAQQATRDPAKIRYERPEGRQEGIYRETSKDAVEELREAVGPDGIYLGSGGTASRSTASVARMLAAEVHFHPGTQEAEDFLNRRVLPLMGMKRTRIRLRRAKVLDPIQEAIIVQKLGLVRALSLNGLLELGRRFVPDFAFPRWDGPLANDIPIAVLEAVAGKNEAVSTLVTQLLEAVVKAIPAQ